MYHSLSLLQDLQEMKKQKRKKKNTNLNYPKLQNGDETTLKYCIYPALEVQGVIYSKGGAWDITWEVWPLATLEWCQDCRGNAAVLGQRAQRRLLRAA